MLKKKEKQEKISEDMPSEPYTAAKLIGPKRSLTTSVTRWAPVVFLCALTLHLPIGNNALITIIRLGFSTNFDVIAGLLRKVRITR
jgi:hypothetical protein